VLLRWLPLVDGLTLENGGLNGAMSVGPLVDGWTPEHREPNGAMSVGLLVSPS
jgi:hypothetical protein